MSKFSKKFYTMNSQKTFLPYEKLLYIKFHTILKEDEILLKSFEELGIKDDFSHKIIYFYEDQATHVFLAKYEDIPKDYAFVIPEPLLFIAYLQKYKLHGKTLFLVYKEKYAVFIEYLEDKLQSCHTLPLSKMDYIQNTKESYTNVIKIDGVKFSNFQDENLYKNLLDIDVDFKLNFSSYKKFNLSECLSFKFLLTFVLGVLIALVVLGFLMIKNHNIQQDILNLKSSLKDQDSAFKLLKEKQQQNDKLSQEYAKTTERIENLNQFYSNVMCYKSFYEFIKILNSNQANIESLKIHDKKFIIEISQDFDFYDEYKNQGFILKNKEVHNGKIILYFEKNI
ncbi:hypothetical protein [Campylobacter volucris]|uniref:hypothetical protein n=1 Tax=Campylobacter volucris TaxID=1031542 RepID=UPI00140534BD|nr:hypothetical protein [Campylobacter volucris]